MKKKKEPDKKENNKKKWRAKVVLLSAFLAGGVCGFLIDRYIPMGDQEQSSIPEIRPGGYEFINPLLECETAQDTVEGKNLRSLKRKIHDFIDEKEKERGISHVSVYYRDLNNGPWIGVDEKVLFSPSSLLKVPLMMAVLKDAETNPQILRQRFTFTDKDSNTFENIKSSKAIELGKSYSAEELIHFMIANSDNNAYLLLLKNFSQDKLIRVYTELGVAVPYDSKKEDFMSVKEYASFFRILFNASYLNREMSMKALKFLSVADYRNGIVAGVPSNVGVVHKFGERSLGADAEIKQMHDCGIVYYPDHPYLLCIMTRGKTFSRLEGIIKDVSQLVYNELDNLYREK
ncbi:MAG: serine hydrolase [Thermodesulfovibrionales bacterium]